MFYHLSAFSATRDNFLFQSSTVLFFADPGWSIDYNIDWWFNFFDCRMTIIRFFLEKFESSQMNFGFFGPWKTLFRFLEITKRHGLEIGGAFFPFSKRWVNTPFKLKKLFILINRPRIWVFRVLPLVVTPRLGLENLRA